ncbi:hypothetical protein BH20VER3_BH20VER3_00900 [soil metagenome]
MNKRVLIVEDQESEGKALARLLQLKKIETECVGTFREALDCVEVSPFNLAILDLRLPDSEPLETLERLAQLSVQTIIFTGVDEPSIIRECQRRNIRFILKGTSASGIVREVLLALEWSEPSLEIEEAIITTNREQVAERTKSKVLSWLSGNIIALILALFIALDHWGVFLGGVRTGVLSDAGMRQQIIDNTRAITDERTGREKTETSQDGINRQVVEELKGIHTDLATLHGESERSKGQREDLLNQITSIRKTTDEIYKYLLDKK